MMTNTNTYIPKMRTIDNAYAEIKKLDPATNFTKCALRRMVANKEIQTIKVGNKVLINLDLLLEKLSCGIYNYDDTCASSVS